MSGQFDFDDISSVEFGVCIDTDEGTEHKLVPINNNVKQALKDMLSSTVTQLSGEGSLSDINVYEPSEKYASKELVRTPLTDEMNSSLKGIYDATNIPTDPTSLANPEIIVYYFAIFHDNQGNKLLAIKRALQFRGIVKAGNIILRMIDETLDIVEDNVFKLDKDFDYFICDDAIYILRPSAFEYTADIELYVLQKASDNALDLATTISFLDCENLSKYVKGHKRAARLLASVRTRSDLDKTSPKKLKKACKDNDIELVTKNGKIAPAPGHEMGFLQMLDRRRYTLSLTDDGNELYEATGRRKAK